MKLGFIGCGNMANAIMSGIIKDGLIPASEIIGADPTAFGRERTLKENGITVTDSNIEVVKEAETLFFTIKPQYFHQMISEIRDYVREDQLIISIAAGRTLDYIQSEFGGKKVKVVRLMPNTPAMVGEGMTAACANDAVTREELDYAVRICSGFGKAEIVPESLFDVVTAVSGSSPAYVFMFIEAMADAAVQGGMPRAQAYTFAAQAVLGSAKMVLDTGKHPGELKDMVCSPAGTTIEAVRVLEEKGFRSAVFECVKACTEKSAEMRKSK
ncbi:MAG: pyrroline-5-carboxylate reductase [Lachnospiraceae bacterium]|jgi:pyrroline-5-carboxylate reductase|nr:pyrroline-5-carboxylate reductase [Lachnospiraceae bacterium]